VLTFLTKDNQFTKKMKQFFFLEIPTQNNHLNQIHRFNDVKIDND